MKKQNYNQYDEDFDYRIYYAALYMRFSGDDSQSNESSSIQTQKMILDAYCKDNGYRIFDRYIDDGYTGSNFDRPEFQRMLKDISAGKINLVITKDLSRLGRDYILSGYYIENFVDNNIRYIAINDCIDTLTQDTDMMPFKNVFNNIYSRDTSRKVKAAKRQRALNGLFINARAPYGYKPDSANKNKLIIDDEPAEIVRLIFKLFLEGKNRYEIAGVLTRMQIIVPSAYKTLQGMKGFTPRRKGKKASCDYKWSYNTIGSILNNRMYAGDMVNHKSEVINYKTKKLAIIPKENFIIVENTHEAIVDRDDFIKVQELIKEKHSPRKESNNIFRGKLFCAGCGSSMTMGFPEQLNQPIIR